MKPEKIQIGMIGLGVMGRNLAYNIADKGFPVVGYDKNSEAVSQLIADSDDLEVKGVNEIEELIRVLDKPRNIMLMVPAGQPVDVLIRELRPLLDPEDLIIDGGNSHFADTEKRQRSLDGKGINLLGVGISGGESGARHGPSIMPGGATAAYQRVKPVLEAIAANVEGQPCVTYLGPNGAGHYVKMVHNGIEYSLMQLIAESYDLLHRGLGASDQELHDIFSWWNQHEPNSYLIEITADIFSEVSNAGKPLIDLILDEAKQKGTGKWTSQNAMDLQVPVPNIDIAVGMRHLSALKRLRTEASNEFPENRPQFSGDRENMIDSLRMAFYAGMIVSFAQGFSLLRTASHSLDYQFDLAEIARIWQGGCIIRAALLHEIHTAFQTRPDLENLLLDPDLGEDVVRLRESLVNVIQTSMTLDIPMPGLMTALAYQDSYRSARLPANLIQAQRDFFGSHQFERVDIEGTFHQDWKET